MSVVNIELLSKVVLFLILYKIYFSLLCVQSAIRKTRDRGEKQKIREDIKYLRKELRQREEAASKEVLKRADVVLATLSSADPSGPIRYLDNEHFDLVVIDECSQVNYEIVGRFQHFDSGCPNN